MNKINTTCEHAKIRLIAAAVGFQQCAQAAGTETLITGTDKRILIGNDAYLAKVAAPAEQSSTVGAAKVASLVFDDFPEFNAQAMGCGLEDRNITDRYDAMRYGFEEALDLVDERIKNFLADVERLLASSAGEHAEPARDERTYMDDKQAYEWAWGQVKRDVGTNGWTVGEHGNYFGFFLHGWRYGKQYERQGTTAAPASPEHVQAESSAVSTDEAREYLVQFMEQYFTDKTFHRYIRGRIGGSGPLAGDFAWQMARALRMILAAPSTAAPAAPEQDDENIKWSHDLQTRLIEAAQAIYEDDSARELMGEAACLLAALTGNAGAMKTATNEGARDE